MNKQVVNNEIRKYTVSVFRAIIIAGICFTILYPMFIKFTICFKSSEDLLDNSIIFLSRHPTLDVIKIASKMMNFSGGLLNTIILCSLSGIFHVISCTLVGYSLGRFQYRFKGIIFILVVLTLIVPPQVISIPMYISFRNFLGIGSLIDNPISLLLLYLTANSLKSGLYIYLLMQFFRNMPKEIEEAALVDGAGSMRTMLYIMLPNARLMMITVFLFTFVWQWTDIFYSSMFFKNFSLLSLNLGVVGTTFAQHASNYLNIAVHPMMVSQINNAGSILFIFPLVILYLICNRFFVQGIERSGIVG